MQTFNIKADIRPLQRAFIDLRAKQVPFATSLALNLLVNDLKVEEVKLIDTTFDTPTPFTENAYRIEVATKAKPVAVLAAKDDQAEYLAPYVVGGPRSLGTKRGMLVPRSVPLNRYGNLAKGKTASLNAKAGVFAGKVKGKNGRVISGLFQRSPSKRTTKGFTPAGPLKLLIQFADTTEAPKRLDFYGRAQTFLSRNAAAAFDVAIRRALATARR